MPLLRERLIDDYADHYARVNAEIDPLRADPARFAHYEANFGPLVRGLPQGSRVLDLGCGTGLLLRWLSGIPGLRVAGIDRSSSQIAVARRALPELEIECGDGLEYLRARPDTFAGVFCTDVLEHVPGKDLVLEWVETIRASLVPGGFLYCRMPNAASLLGSYSRYRDLTHEQSYTSDSIVQLLSAGGLRDCRVAPIQGADFSSRLRLWLEHRLHKLLFRLCGETTETVFTTNVCAVAYRR
jgi:2-polyprenyl-3-methyl-5-hydroxy-6-metoxy-1,4-benzoquinol methylase